MVSKVAFVVVLGIALFQVSEVASKTILEEDYDHLVQPVIDAYNSLKHSVKDVVHKIEENPIYKDASATVSEKYTKAKNTLATTYDKLAGCRHIISEGIVDLLLQDLPHTGIRSHHP